jgi:rhodanese-related sulfurtransferase
MKAVLLRLLVLLSLAATPAMPATADTKVDTAVTVIFKLCVGSGSDVKVNANNQNQLQIDSGNGNVTLERHETQGLIDGLNSQMTNVEADQANRVRDCVKPYIGEIMHTMLYPQNAVPEPQRAQTYTPPPSAPSLLNAAYRTNLASEAVNFGVVPTIGLNRFVNESTPSYINGGAVITTGELEHAMSSGIPFALIDVLLSPHQPLPRARGLPGAGMVDEQNDLAKQNWFIGQLLAITGGSYDYPIVLYCLGVNCWESFNAATRAIIGGFKNVYWYRGGIEAWYRSGQGGMQAAQAPMPIPAAPPPIAAPVSQRVIAPSWCANAGKPSERTICGSSVLANLDSQLSDAYQAARNRTSGYQQQQLIRDQRSWLQDRDGCGSDGGCIERAYRDRLSELSGG